MRFCLAWVESWEAEAPQIQLTLGVEIVGVEIGGFSPDSLLASDAEFGPGYRVEALRGNRLLASSTYPVGRGLNPPKRRLHLAQQFHVERITVQEDPLFVTLLTQVTFIGGYVQARNHLRDLLR